MRWLETRVLLAVWSISRPTRAKEVMSSLLTPNHCPSTVMRTRYQRAVRMRCITIMPYLSAVGGCILLKLDRFPDLVQYVLGDTFNGAWQ